MQDTNESSRRELLGAIGLRLALFAALWLVLTNGSTNGLYLAALFVPAATATSLLLLPPRVVGWRPLRLPRFLAYFLIQSLLGGIDVSRRALDPRLPIEPDLVRYRLHLQGEAPAVMLAYIVSLLPGTVAARLEQEWILVHVLDRRLPIEANLAELETQIARLFGET